MPLAFARSAWSVWHRSERPSRLNCSNGVFCHRLMGANGSSQSFPLTATSPQTDFQVFCMLIVLLVFLSVTLGLFMAFHALSSFLLRDPNRIHQRIVEEFGNDKQAHAPLALYKNLAKLGVSTVPVRPNLQDRLRILLSQAQFPLTIKQLFLAAGGLGIGAGSIGFWFGSVVLGIMLCPVGMALPFMLVQFKRKARQERFLKQLPNAFELMARVIRAGQSVPQALQAVAEAFSDPIASDFANCQHQQNLGLSPEVTYHQMAQRSGILELRIFVMAMLIHRQTGGHLSEVLERLAGLTRARLRLRQHIRTLTAEGRLQGLTLVVLPFLMFGVMMVLNREYAKVLLDHVPMIVATIGCMAIGVLWIRRIVNLKI
jgi:tight adherence protein B